MCTGLICNGIVTHLTGALSGSFLVFWVLAIDTTAEKVKPDGWRLITPIHHQGTIYTYSQDMFVRTIGIELNIPLYAGGYISSLVDQAKSNLKKAKSDLEDKSNKIYIELYRQYSSVQTILYRIKTLGRSVDTARNLIDATQKNIRGGEQVKLDLLNARLQYRQACQDLAKARYDYINTILRLKADAGTLSTNDIKWAAENFTQASAKETGATGHTDKEGVQ